MTSKKLGKSISAYVLIMVLIIGSFSVVDQNQKSTDNQLFEDNSNILPKMFSQRNSNDWSASATAANPAVLNSIDSSPNNELIVAGIISGSTTMSMGSASITSGQYIEPWIAKSDVNGNWQWIASTGVDPKPYFQRLFNPMQQSSKYDPDAAYIKKWLPELADIPTTHLHDWGKYHVEYNVKELGYYKPIVDYTVARKDSIAMYRSVL